MPSNHNAVQPRRGMLAFATKLALGTGLIALGLSHQLAHVADRRSAMATRGNLLVDPETTGSIGPRERAPSIRSCSVLDQGACRRR